jgi:hypothetical protein
MQRRLGLETTVLHQLANRADRDTGQTHRVYALENRSPEWTPTAGARWVGKEMLEGLQLAVSEHRPHLETWFAEVEELPARRVSWARPGWYDDASSWVRDQSARAGMPITGPVEQVRSWERSCILRASTESGEVYLKAVPPMFASEPPLTQALADRYPEHLPRVLAVEPERGWLLMLGVQGTALDQFRDLRTWESALRAFALLQVDAASHVDQWLALGCPDRRLDRLTAAIGPLVEDPSVLLSGQEHGLSDSEIARLQSLTPQLQAMGAELASYGIPASLEHGDFYFWQILISDDTPIYIDWSEGSVSHPFFSMLLFFAYAEMEQRLPVASDARERLRDTYLEPWTARAPIDRLRRAFDISQTLAPLHHAVTYQQLILPHLEDPTTWDAMAPWFLKMTLARAAAD